MSSASGNSNASPVRLGYVPGVDSAPVMVAEATGGFGARGPEVRLSREIGWASVREKLIHGELDAAHCAPGIAISLGSGPAGVVVPMVLGLEGGAIVISSRIDNELVGGGERLVPYLRTRWKKRRPFIVAVPHRDSNHYWLVRRWLEGIAVTEPGLVEIVTLPAALMPAQLEGGLIDGFSAGEPWLAGVLESGAGWCAFRTEAGGRPLPGGVLAVGSRFFREERERTLDVVSALIAACRRCQSPDFRPELVSILSGPKYLGVRAGLLEECLGTPDGGVFDRAPVFHGRDANLPDMGKAGWALGEFERFGHAPEHGLPNLAEVFREDLYREAEDLKRP